MAGRSTLGTLALLAATASLATALQATPSQAAEPVAARDAGRVASGRAASGLIATHLVRAVEGGPVLRRARVEFSARGRRITQPGTGQRIVVNGAQERVWFVDRHRRVVHEVPLVASAGAKGDADREAAAGAAFDGGHPFASTLCEGARADGLSAVRWWGRPVERATCVGDGGTSSVQTFDPEAGIVVRVVADGRVEELRDMEFVALAPELFEPSASLREVGIGELLGGAPPVADYVEP